MAAAYKIIPGIVKIVNTLSQMKAYESSLDEITVGAKKSPGTQIKVEGIESFRLSNIGFKYAGVPTIKNLSFSISTGDFVGITGKSGQGKTTILNLLLGFLTPDTGEILFNDLPVGKNETKKFWPFISYVRQQPFFIHDTVLRNITLEEESYDRERLETVVEISGVNDLIADSIDGINKIITENGKNISGGQQQRVALARALYKDADLILLDEPFNELDEVSELSLLNHFSQLAGNGKMILMITHNKKALSFCNKIISLDEP
jgi:ABC-type bacteriocin/lantibiotic exporter with double-glycine peptidase domain